MNQTASSILWAGGQRVYPAAIAIAAARSGTKASLPRVSLQAARGTERRTILCRPIGCAAAVEACRAGGRRGGAFTLIELLAVVAILAILVTLLVPSLQKARELARRTICRGNMHALALAANLYNEDYRCLAPGGYRPPLAGNPTHVWYQKRFLGRYFGEDLPLSLKVDKISAPPMKSILRCPTPAVWEGINPLSSWIAYNGAMAAGYYSPEDGRNYYWRGPKLEEIKHNPSVFLLFGDGRGSGLQYIGGCAYRGYLYDYIKDDKNTTDGRHNNSTTPPACPNGGIDAAFLDGHAAFFDNDTLAHEQGKMFISPVSTNK